MDISKPKIYVASKTAHAPMWREMREKGYQINSSWIDEAGPGESSDRPSLAMKCINEAFAADCLIAFYVQGETWKGAFIEIGAALAAENWVYIVGKPNPDNFPLPFTSVFVQHPKLIHCLRLQDAFDLAEFHYKESLKDLPLHLTYVYTREDATE